MSSRKWKTSRALVGLLSVATVVSAAGEQWTTKHEAGRCAIRGQCGKQGWFGGELPCPDNGLAEEPVSAVREKLVGICGDKWASGPVCCDDAQIDALQSNLKKADPMITSCPACKTNFYNLFCTFTCSPDQSLFVNVTDIAPKGDKFQVTQLDNLWSEKYGSGFYDSCKDVKFGATNGKAMDFIGGGAKNYTQFLKFLGKKQLLGSPFQIDFPSPKGDFPGMKPVSQVPKACNDSSEQYRCSCVDCAASCPALPEVTETKSCHVGKMACLSFGVVLAYSIFLALLVTAITGHVAYRKHARSKNERLQLLQDSALSDDEDEGDLVHNPNMLERPQRNYWINSVCDRAFSKLGHTCAEFPAITIVTSVIIVALLSIGWVRFTVETDPEKLMVAPNSAAAEQKAFFDASFGPFFRAEQAFLVNDLNEPGPVMSYETLDWWFDVENRVRRLKSVDHGVTFDQVCYNPTGAACVVQSMTGYFGGDFDNLSPKSWQTQLSDCAAQPVDCLPDFGQPLSKNLIFGGYNGSVVDAQALVVTWVVKNHAKDDPELEKAMDWEESLKGLLLAVQGEAKDRGLRLSFTTEISLEEELNKSSNTDAKIVVISYIIMFLYASLALGSTTLAARSILHNPANALVQSKFMLGTVGIIIVLMSVSASVGLFSAVGVKVTLIIAEVIPFLVLAVGVDNIFLIVHEFERVNINYPEGSIPERTGKALGRMGPSILLAATTETAAFALGAAVGMPAVRNFAAYAAGAVFINAVLQVTMFVSVLALNQQRVESNRADCVPCITVKTADSGLVSGGILYGANEEGAIEKFIRKVYAPALLGRKTRVAIITIFLGIFTAGLALFPSVQLGLDQRIAIPSDSYLIPYFNDLYDYFNSGPPVYFVTRGLNATQQNHQKELCGRFSTCNEFSLANVLEQERKRPEVSYIADATASWIDDFFYWLNPEFDKCCVDGFQACFVNRNPPWNMTLSGMPEGPEFVSYLQRWLKAPTTQDCPIAGAAAYSDALLIDSEQTTIAASHFRTAHTPLRSQKDFIDSYASAKRIAAAISKETGSDVFPYSKHYIFFDQYSSIVHLSMSLLGSGLTIILLLTTVLLGSLATGVVVTVTVAMILVDIVGTMALFNVSLNAVSLVNLVISLGIGLEFCAHIARAFAFPSGTVMERAPRHKYNSKEARAWTALVNVGGSVFSGITITKLLGVFVLAFTKSKIFEVYYFRVWLALVVWAASHALVFLPVALSFFGGEGYVDPESAGGLEEDLRSRRYPALLGDDEYDSD